MLLNKPKRWVLLVYGLNVILPGAAFTLMINVPVMLCEGNACADKLPNLCFIHREYYYWYNQLPSSLFLELFINRYRLHMYHFS